jgi:glycosyltransferase involved in cell wall biosynthesis
MGCGIPFIGTGDGEIVRLAEESGAGIITNLKPVDIAAAINKLNNDDVLCKNMGENGRKYVEREYNKPIIIKRLYEVIKKVYLAEIKRYEENK